MTCAAAPPRPWSRERIARLGYLVGRGVDVALVARDPAVDTTPGNVRRQARRFGLALREESALRLPAAVRARLDAAAARRGLGRDRLIRALLLAAGSDAALIDNILDDDA